MRISQQVTGIKTLFPARPQVIKKRFNTYVKETMPVINFFAAQGKVHKIVADKPVDLVRALLAASTVLGLQQHNGSFTRN